MLLQTKQNIYVATLDCSDAFGSVSHELLKINLTNLGLPDFFRNVIIDSYKDANVEIWTRTGCSNPIQILRGVKQGCPLSPVLFDICLIQYLITYNKQLIQRKHRI
jgi:hypothetical protein